MFQAEAVEKIKTHFLRSITFLVNRALCDMMWKNTVQPDRPQMTVWRMRVASYVPKATDTHSEYVILIAFPLQQWLLGSASVLYYTYIACLFFLNIHLIHVHLGLSRGLYLSGDSNKSVYEFLFVTLRATCPTQLVLHDLTTRIIFVAQCKY